MSIREKIKRIFASLIGFSLLSLMISCGGGSVDSSPDLNVGSQSCGNGALNENEACDDGNPNNSDGCNSNCALEVGEADCGNGVKENEECCDDGNNVNGDGCSSACASEKNNHSPTVPVLASSPADGVTWAPTRLYLSWEASIDSDVEDQIVYDVYFVELNGIPENAVPYKKGITDTHFIIQASTDNRAEFFPSLVRPIYLEADKTYTWKVCARDEVGASSCSESRIFNTDDSVVGWWRFDENPYGVVCPDILGGPAGDIGETVCDYSGKGNHGRQRGMPVWLPPDPILLGGVLRFDGVDDWVEVENSASLNLTSEITIEVYENLQTLGEVNNRPLITKLATGDQADATGYNLTFRTGTELLFSIDSVVSGQFVAANLPTSLENWKHIVSTYDGLNGRVYDDGALVMSTSFGNEIGVNNQPLFIGRTYSAAHFYNGSISDALIYSRLLTDLEIRNAFLAK